MNKQILALAISTLIPLTIATQAKADDRGHSLLYSCNMSFHASGRSIYLGIGYTEVSGKGTLSCYDFGRGTTEQIPLKITARGPGAGLGVTGLVLSGGATGVGITASPESLLGHYVMVRGNAAAGIGAGAGAALRLSNGAATVDVSVQAQTGLGAGVDLLWLNIENAGPARLDEAQLDHKPADTPVQVTAAPSTPAQNLAPIAMTATPSPAPAKTTAIPTSVVTIRDGQPIELLDSKGRVTQLIYVNRQ